MAKAPIPGVPFSGRTTFFLFLIAWATIAVVNRSGFASTIRPQG